MNASTLGNGSMTWDIFPGGGPNGSPGGYWTYHASNGTSMLEVQLMATISPQPGYYLVRISQLAVSQGGGKFAGVTGGQLFLTGSTVNPCDNEPTQVNGAVSGTLAF